jgi:hypothetical protein
MPNVITISDLRKLTRKPSHVINHALNRYGPPPAGRIGITRYWNESDLSEILASIDKTQAGYRSPQGVA